METNTYALVLTGSVLPGHDAERAWPALATYFRMDAARLDELLRRAPLAIKQGDDIGKLQTLESGMAALGVDAELCAPDGRANLFVLLDNRPCGPLPGVFVEQRIASGTWPDRIRVAEVGSQDWVPFAAPPAQLPPVTDAADPVAAPNTAVTRQSAPLTLQELAPDEPAVDTTALPGGPAIHAGFWRRCAASIIDGILIGIAVLIVQAGLGVGTLLSVDSFAALVGVFVLAGVMAFLGQWLYFALFESSGAQATPGKRALGIKVVDASGRRIGFGRASGRYFGKVVSGMIFNIGYLLAGWTSRKQALHDMLAGTLVVFRTVQSDAPLPTVRPPMPWYGWLLNALLVLACLALILGTAISGSAALHMLQGVSL